MTTNYCTKTPADAKNKGGRPRDPNKRVFVHLGLRPADWTYLEQWKSETGEETNFNDAIERLIEFAKDFAPGGPEVKKERDEQGRFKPTGGCSRGARTRERRRRMREKEEVE